MQYAQLRIRRLEKIELFTVPDETEIEVGDYVIIESPKSGTDYGVVLSLHEQPPYPLKEKPLSILRKVTMEDINRIEENYRYDEEAFRICFEKIVEKKLTKMKLLDAEYSFNRTVVTFYYFAEERIDFRELVRELAKVFSCRIEMRQVGRRDESRMLGGLGVCGRPLCCSLFLREFKPISIRMAREQNLPLDPNKISGICGRLLCCLAYELETNKTTNQINVTAEGKEEEVNESD